MYKTKGNLEKINRFKDLNLEYEHNKHEILKKIRALKLLYKQSRFWLGNDHEIKKKNIYNKIVLFNTTQG